MPITALRTAVPPPVARDAHPVMGPADAPILVVCDAPRREAWEKGLPIDGDAYKLIVRSAKKHGFDREDLAFVGLCPPMPADALSSAKRKWDHVLPHVESLRALITARRPRCVVTLGELASRSLLDRAVAITRARGVAVRHDERVVFPMLSPGFVLRMPEHTPTFDADWLGLRKLVQQGFALEDAQSTDIVYAWREDIADLLADRPAMLSLDTETTGLVWHDPAVTVLTVQLCVEPGRAIACPVDQHWWPGWQGRPRFRGRLIAQLKELLEDPAVRKVGHNLKFDVMMLRKLGIEVAGWTDDTQLMAFAVDENMMEKSLDECTRRWVPAMAGYADQFNAATDKSRMRDVPPERMLPYAAGDVDACLRLYRRLDAQLDDDPKQRRCYERILMPAIRAFANSIERYGMLVDQQRLAEFGGEVGTWLGEQYRELIRMVPPAVRKAHLDAGKELKFSRGDFVRDTLFGPEGFKLKPVVFTATTRDLPPEQREPSTSSKQHLPFFADREDKAGAFVRGLIEYQQGEKLLGTYIGKQEDDNGLWQYIAPDSRIYPSYSLHGTVTGRTNSSNPNGQNFPKRGRWAKPYQRIFTASPGWKLVNCDLSQIELRIAAWMAMEPVMLRVYREDGDIHTATAKAVAQLTDEQWSALSKVERKNLRTKAKAVGFGFLYGMGATKFRNYAKTDYGVDYTQREAEEARERFFGLYRRLPAWHTAMREFVRQHGFVRALHGAKRNLPSIYSNDEVIRSGAERQAINSPVQRFGSDLGLMSVIRFVAQADPELFRVIGFVHDAIVMEVRDGYEREGISALLWAMANPPLEAWFGLRAPLPIKAEADIGLTGGEMYELAELPPPEQQPDWLRALDLGGLGPVKPGWWRDDLDETSPEAGRILLAA